MISLEEALRNVGQAIREWTSTLCKGLGRLPSCVIKERFRLGPFRWFVEEYRFGSVLHRIWLWRLTFTWWQTREDRDGSV